MVGNKNQKGFTLVEILIVVIILAILAAIVVPQFSGSTRDAQTSSLSTTLSNMRAAIDLYRQQHDEYPGAVTAVPTACAGTAGTGAADTATAFMEQMAYYTNAAGQACSTQSDGADANAFPFGPYLKKDTLPANPITGIDTLNIVSAGDLDMAGAAVAAGWKVDTETGKFIADDAQNADDDGNTFDTY